MIFRIIFITTTQLRYPWLIIIIIMIIISYTRTKTYDLVTTMMAVRFPLAVRHFTGSQTSAFSLLSYRKHWLGIDPLRGAYCPKTQAHTLSSQKSAVFDKIFQRAQNLQIGKIIVLKFIRLMVLKQIHSGLGILECKKKSQKNDIFC